MKKYEELSVFNESSFILNRVIAFKNTALVAVSFKVIVNPKRPLNNLPDGSQESGDSKNF